LKFFTIPLKKYSKLLRYNPAAVISSEQFGCKCSFLCQIFSLCCTIMWTTKTCSVQFYDFIFYFKYPVL